MIGNDVCIGMNQMCAFELRVNDGSSEGLLVHSPIFFNAEIYQIIYNTSPPTTVYEILVIFTQCVMGIVIMTT